jgi:hypothetical protein
MDSKHINKSGYFKAPDEIFNLDLSSKAKLILINLCRRADSNGISFPSRHKIASDCSMGIRTVDEGLKELVSKEIIKKNPNLGKSNTYQLSNELIKIILPKINRIEPAQYLPKGDAEFAHLPAQILHPKEYPIKGKPNKEIQELEEFEDFFKAFRETNKLLGRENCGDKGKAFAEHKKISKKDKYDLLPYLAECKRKKSVADAIKVVKTDRKDSGIQVPNLSWFSDCQRFLKNREWESKNIFPVESALDTDSQLQKKQWENEGYIEGLHFKFIKKEVHSNVV